MLKDTDRIFKIYMAMKVLIFQVPKIEVIGKIPRQLFQKVKIGLLRRLKNLN